MDYQKLNHDLMIKSRDKEIKRLRTERDELRARLALFDERDQEKQVLDAILNSIFKRKLIVECSLPFNKEPTAGNIKGSRSDIFIIDDASGESND